MNDPLAIVIAELKASQLRCSYESARQAARMSAKFSAEDCPAKTCRYCGEFWWPFAGTKLDGHAKCQVPESFKVYVGGIKRAQQAIADEIGVSLSVLRAWIAPIRSST